MSPLTLCLRDVSQGGDGGLKWMLPIIDLWGRWLHCGTLTILERGLNFCVENVTKKYKLTVPNGTQFAANWETPINLLKFFFLQMHTILLSYFLSLVQWGMHKWHWCLWGWWAMAAGIGLPVLPWGVTSSIIMVFAGPEMDQSWEWNREARLLNTG